MSMLEGGVVEGFVVVVGDSSSSNGENDVMAGVPADEDVDGEISQF
jgi:hypothetical protein